jgi:hypothetical protein
MISLSVHDNAASMHAYTPPAIVEHRESASTSSPSEHTSPHTGLGAKPRKHDETEFVDIAAFATQKIIDIVDPRDQSLSEISKKAETTRQAKAGYRERIAELTTDAAFDGITLNKASECDFWAFFRTLDFFRKGKLYILDNGNLRAVWKSKTGDHIGIQFLGNGTVQFVMFKQRNRASSVSRVAGRDTIDGVRRQLAAFELDDLIKL